MTWFLIKLLWLMGKAQNWESKGLNSKPTFENNELYDHGEGNQLTRPFLSFIQLRTLTKYLGFIPGLTFDVFLYDSKHNLMGKVYDVLMWHSGLESE